MRHEEMYDLLETKRLICSEIQEIQAKPIEDQDLIRLGFLVRKLAKTTKDIRWLTGHQHRR